MSSMSKGPQGQLSSWSPRPIFTVIHESDGTQLTSFTTHARDEMEAQSIAEDFYLSNPEYDARRGKKNVIVRIERVKHA